MADSNYNRGEMDIQGHSGTFSGFMGFSIYGGAAIILTLLMPILIFAAGFAWFPSLVATVIVGILIGLGLKFKGQYYAVLIALAALVFVIVGLLDLFAF